MRFAALQPTCLGWAVARDFSIDRTFLQNRWRKAWRWGRVVHTVIVGAGLMGRYHARAAARAGACVVAIVDRDERAASELAARFPGAVAQTDPRHALAAVKADVVHICTPPDSHVSLARLAAEAGCHALIEKPIATTAQDTRRIFEDFSRARRLVCPTHQYAFQRSVRAAAAAFPRMAPVRQIAVEICSAGGHNDASHLDRLAADILPHPLAILQKLVPGADLASLDWSCLRTGAGEWLITAPLLETALSITMSMNGRPTRFVTRVIADRGSLELDHFHDFCIELSADVSKARKIALPFVRGSLGLAAASRNLVARAARAEFAYPGLRALVSEFYAAVRNPGNVPLPISPGEAINAAEARDRLIALAGYD